MDTSNPVVYVLLFLVYVVVLGGLAYAIIYFHLIRSVKRANECRATLCDTQPQMMRVSAPPPDADEWEVPDLRDATQGNGEGAGTV